VTEQQANVVLGITRKSLEGVVIHACPNCQAPGVYKADQRTLDNWPGCWNPVQCNQPVGDTCPNCGATRKRDKNLGELTSSMPRWVWNLVLAFKWCLIKAKGVKHG